MRLYEWLERDGLAQNHIESAAGDRYGIGLRPEQGAGRGVIVDAKDDRIDGCAILNGVVQLVVDDDCC